MAPAAASNLQGQGPAANIAEVTEYFPLGPVTSASRSFLRLRLNGDCRELFVLRQAGVAPALFCRASWPKALRARLFPSADEDVRRVWGVALLRAAPPEPYTVSDLHRSLSEDLGTDLGQQGTAFVPGPWSSTCRVKGVAEHCRPARLGFWGWLFRLKHSVLAVRLQCPDAATEDLLYLDKNADVGVSWRRAG
ncbi:Ttn [Symbiodinium sp. KB8]|nr:Ttn [Symbiodinium sp. KB8]